MKRIKGDYLLFLIATITELIFLSACEKTDETVKDLDGNVYNTVTIGSQTWMVENLKTTKYRNGDPIPYVTGNPTWANTTSGAYCKYIEDASTIKTYGLYYNWYAINDTRRIAPIGWHVATKAEWETLISYLGGETVAGGKMKEVGTTHWQTPNTGATNESGFTALPGGMTNGGGATSGSMGIGGLFWTSTETSGTQGWHYEFGYTHVHISYGPAQKFVGISVRCIKD